MDLSRHSTLLAASTSLGADIWHDGEWLLQPGSMVDHFRVLRPLGRGGMAEVHLARDTKLGRRVALKLLRTDLLDNVASTELLLREARATATFSHPNIVTIHTLGTHQGVPYLALEYIDGQTLHERQQQWPSTVAEGLRHMLAVTAAVCEAHRHGVLHLDLKPENVLVGQDGRARVVDFGIAQLVNPEDGKRPTLRSGDEGEEPVLAGTPAYMAPEQWLLLPCSDKADVWALGVMLFELAGGRLPYPHRDLDALRRSVAQIDEPAPALEGSGEVPIELVALVGRCLAKLPDERPTAQQLHEALGALVHRDTRVWDEAEAPFRGLLPFTERQAALYFGRELEIDTFCERLRLTPLLPVVGASGAGKSSFVQAGVIPRLRELASWRMLAMRPGRRPFERLCSQLAAAGSRPRHDSADPEPSSDAPRSDLEARICKDLQEQPERLALYLGELADAHGGPVLLFVDQLEELFTMVPDEVLRRRFLHALFSAAEDAKSPVRIIVTLRDDFLGQLASWLDGVMVLRSLDAEALAHMLSRTVEAVGYRFEQPQLLQKMVEAVEGEAGTLPLLQFACRQLWKRRDRDHKVLTQEGYHAIGGVAGALAQHLDDVLAGMPPEQEQLAREIFLRLITPQATRRVVAKERLISDLGKDAAAVIEKLTKERAILVQKGQAGPELELVHESVISSWGQLVRWLEDSREERLFLADATQAAQLWDKRGRLEEEVWQGEALREAGHKAARCRNVPEEVERFLAAGRAREHRLTRRRRVLLSATIGILSTVAVVVSLLAVRAERQAARADRNALRANQNALRAEREAQQARSSEQKVQSSASEAAKQAAGARNAGRLTSATLYRADATLVLALMREMEAEGPLPPQWRQLSRRALHQDIAQVVLSHDSAVAMAALSPDGQRVATVARDNTVRIWSSDGRGQPIVLRGHQDLVYAASFSPDSRRVVTASWDKTARVWSADGQGQPIVLEGHQDYVYSAAFSPDGSRVITASKDNTARIWSADGQGRPIVLKGHRDYVYSAAFSPDGSRVVTASKDKTARVWSADGRGQPIVLKGHRDVVHSAAFSANGKRIATASWDKTARLWNADGQGRPIVLRGHQDRVHAVAFHPDNTRLITASSDKTARVWDLTAPSSRRPTIISGHRDAVSHAAFSADGRRIITASWDKTARIWDARGRRPTLLSGHDDLIYSAAFSPDGRRVVTASWDKTARVWDSAGKEPPIVLRGHEDKVVSAAFSPDGKRIVTASLDKTARVWRPDEVGAGSGRPLLLKGHRDAVFSAAFSPDGERIITASWDKTARLWSADGEGQPLLLKGHGEQLYSASFSPDGTLVATSSRDKTARIWKLDDVLTGRGEPITLSGHRDLVYAASFSPDGKRIVTASFDKTARVWQLDQPKPDGSLPFIELRGHASRLAASGARSGSGAFSPDSLRVLTLSDDKTLRIWSSDGSGPPALLHVPEIDAHSAAFSPDGRRIITTSHSALDPLSGETTHWAAIWSSFERLSGLDDAALWTATRYCPPPALREQLLGKMPEGMAEARFRRCQERVEAAFTAQQR